MSSPNGLLLEEVLGRVDGFLAGEQAISLPTGRWTTPEMLALEAEALDLAQRQRLGPAPSADLVADAIAARPSLSGEQRRAVRHLTSGSPVSLVVGHAGAGKTFALDAARGAWQASGHAVVGCSLSARAARNLEASAGIPSDTADKLLGDLDAGRRALDARSVVVVDEAGMLGSRRLVRLLRHTAAAGGKLVLVGDPKQLPEIDAGGLFAALARSCGHTELTENRRQHDRRERRAARELRSREVDKALLSLSRAGRLSTDGNADVLRDRLVDDWHLETRVGADAVMLAIHRSDVADLNARARARLAASGQLGEVLLTIGDDQFAVGDRVMALRNNRRLGLLNGTTGTVVGSAGRSLLVRPGAWPAEAPVPSVKTGSCRAATRPERSGSPTSARFTSSPATCSGCSHLGAVGGASRYGDSPQCRVKVLLYHYTKGEGHPNARYGPTGGASFARGRPEPLGNRRRGGPLPSVEAATPPRC